MKLIVLGSQGGCRLITQTAAKQNGIIEYGFCYFPGVGLKALLLILANSLTIFIYKAENQKVYKVY